MPHAHYKTSLLMFATLSTLGMACGHKSEEEMNCPAFAVYQSEKLIIPAAVDLPAGKPDRYKRVATYFAKGVQKYKAQQKAGSNPAMFEWIFVAPQANLYDASNVKIGTHSAGPAWQLSRPEKDSIFGQQFSPPRSAPSQGANSIDWLLLMPKAGKAPTGIFSNVSYIQRIATKGGKAPASLPISADETIDVSYTAVYRFTKINP